MLVIGVVLIKGLLLIAAMVAAPPADPDPGRLLPGDYGVEPLHTRVEFSVSHMGFTDWWGDLTGVSGTLHIDPGRPESSLPEVVIPTASVSTTNPVLDGELRQADWLDAAHYPQISFRSVHVVRTGPREGDIEGRLTLHGVNRPVTLHARFNGAGTDPLDRAYIAGFSANAILRRSEFGVTKYIPLVGDALSIRISAAFQKR